MLGELRYSQEQLRKCQLITRYRPVANYTVATLLSWLCLLAVAISHPANMAGDRMFMKQTSTNPSGTKFIA